jgi:hypothetical protein
VSFHQALGNAEAETCAFDICGLLNSSEWLEDPLKILLSDAHSIVGDLDLDSVCVIFDANSYATTFRRKLGGIAKQVRQDLAESDWVSLNR